MITRVEYYKINDKAKASKIVTYYIFGLIPIYRNKVILLENETEKTAKEKIRKLLNLC